MKNSSRMISMVTFCIINMVISSCSKDDDFGPGTPTRSIDIYGSVEDSATGQSLENAVVWMKQTYLYDIEVHTVTNDLGKFLFHIELYDVNDSKNYTIYISKGGFEMSRLNIRIDSTDQYLNIKLVADPQDTIAPFCIGWDTFSNYETKNTEVIFYFSEEVVFDTPHIPDLVQIIFQRRYDICSYSSTAFIYEHQDDVYSSDPTSIKFVHRQSDSQTCYSSTSSYSYTQTADWNFHSVQLLPYLCKDLSGNFLKEYSWIGK